jgi:hypothetical protein
VDLGARGTAKPEHHQWRLAGKLSPAAPQAFATLWAHVSIRRQCEDSRRGKWLKCKAKALGLEPDSFKRSSDSRRTLLDGQVREERAHMGRKATGQQRRPNSKHVVKSN